MSLRRHSRRSRSRFGDPKNRETDFGERRSKETGEIFRRKAEMKRVDFATTRHRHIFYTARLQHWPKLFPIRSMSLRRHNYNSFTYPIPVSEWKPGYFLSAAEVFSVLHKKWVPG